jgi:hypothetical protein
MKQVEISIIDKNGFALEEARWSLDENKLHEIILIIGKREYFFDDSGELFLNARPYDVWTVCYGNPLAGNKGEALYYNCRARDNKDAIRQAMRCGEFTEKILMKYFDFKYFKTFKPQFPKEEEIGKVQFYEGDPRL